MVSGREKAEFSEGSIKVYIVTSEGFREGYASLEGAELLMYHYEDSRIDNIDIFDDRVIGTFTVPMKQNVIDDQEQIGFYMTGEELGFALERILEAGAVEAFTAAVGMKKSRPGVLVTVLCPRDRREPVVQAMFRHTSTIGIRQTLCSRYVLSREAVRECTRFGEVSRKESRGWGVCRSKYEYEDLAAIARREDLSIAQVRRILEGES